MAFKHLKDCTEGERKLRLERKEKRNLKRLHRNMCKFGEFVSGIVSNPLSWTIYEAELINIGMHIYRRNPNVKTLPTSCKEHKFIKNIELSRREMDVLLTSVGVMLLPKCEYNALKFLVERKLTRALYTKHRRKIQDTFINRECNY